jgi:hypothetical protein
LLLKNAFPLQLKRQPDFAFQCEDFWFSFEPVPSTLKISEAGNHNQLTVFRTNHSKYPIVPSCMLWLWQWLFLTVGTPPAVAVTFRQAFEPVFDCCFFGV